MQDVGIATIMGVSFQRIADFQNAAGNRVAVGVDHQRIVQPLAHFMRERGNSLRDDTKK